MSATEQAYQVAVVSQEEADAFLRRMSGPGGPPRQNLRLLGGFELSGEFSLTARDVSSGEVAWEYSGKNLITDMGRRQWMETKWAGARVCFAPSTEVPLAGRNSIITDGSQCVESAHFVPSILGGHTKQWATTYTAPASNRTLATIALGRNVTVADANQGLTQVVAFALLTPPKTQTTTQTLEVVYRVSMNPIA